MDWLSTNPNWKLQSLFTHSTDNCPAYTHEHIENKNYPRVCPLAAEIWKYVYPNEEILGIPFRCASYARKDCCLQDRAIELALTK